MGSSRFPLRNGGAVQIYNYDKGVSPLTGENIIPVYVTDSISHLDSSVGLTADEAVAVAHELIEQAAALRHSND